MFIIVFVGSIQNSNYRKNNSDDNNNNNNTNNNTNYSSNSYNGNNSNTGIVTGIITTIAVIIPLRNDCIYCPLYCSFSQKNDFLLCVCKYQLLSKNLLEKRIRQNSIFLGFLYSLSPDPEADLRKNRAPDIGPREKPDPNIE